MGMSFSIFGLHFETVYFCLAIPMVFSFFTAVSGNNSTITMILIPFLTRETMRMDAT